MATYVTSDAHGHARALDEALSAVSPGSDDVFYVLGDLVDRGPEPMAVVDIVRALPNVQVLMGNHERIMLTALDSSGNPESSDFDAAGFMDWTLWMQNGGATTAAGMEGLSEDALEEFVGWVRALPLHAAVEVAGRRYALTHAGVRPEAVATYLQVVGAAGPELTLEQVDQMLEAQDPEDLLWVREPFWGNPTGLLDATGAGPILIVGHTPAPYLSVYSGDESVVGATEEGLGKITALGACEATGGVPDRVDIDCAAAGGAGVGRVGILRLDDGEVWYAPVREGE